MEGRMTYLNTDLDLVSKHDLTALATFFESRGMWLLPVTHGNDGLWYATFEMHTDDTEPEPHIAAMLSVAESLKEPYHTTWTNCASREFNIGYGCGNEPWAFNQRLSSELLGRIAAINADLRITLYPDRANR